MTDILVAGGAGYIGSFMCKYLAQNGYNPVVVDNLIHGHREAVKWGPFYEGCMSNAEVLEHIFSKHSIKAVMHFAAFCYVGESVLEPLSYYHNNVSNTLSLLESMQRNNVKRLIFSSSCATYGEPREIPITEQHAQKPINPYGKSKLMVEEILQDLEAACGLQSISLRYFNAAGADPEGHLGENHDPETHLIPLILQAALGKRKEVSIFGTDYPTPDGTCIRDYIHIVDLAQAHLIALERLLDNRPGGCFNLGTGKGYSVREVIEYITRVTGKNISVNLSARRAGDPAVLISSCEKAIADLRWRPTHSDLDTIVKTAWGWHRRFPNGY